MNPKCEGCPSEGGLRCFYCPEVQGEEEKPMTDEQYGEQMHADDMDQQALYSDLRRGW